MVFLGLLLHFREERHWPGTDPKTMTGLRRYLYLGLEERLWSSPNKLNLLTGMSVSSQHILT